MKEYKVSNFTGADTFKAADYSSPKEGLRTIAGNTGDTLPSSNLHEITRYIAKILKRL